MEVGVDCLNVWGVVVVVVVVVVVGVGVVVVVGVVVTVAVVNNTTILLPASVGKRRVDGAPGELLLLLGANANARGAPNRKGERHCAGLLSPVTKEKILNLLASAVVVGH